MKVKTFKVQKKDVEKLSNEELDFLISWGKSKEFKLIKELGNEAITRRALEAMESVYTDFKSAIDHGKLTGMKIGIDFILDLPQRAVEELKNREK